MDGARRGWRAIYASMLLVMTQRLRGVPTTSSSPRFDQKPDMALAAAEIVGGALNAQPSRFDVNRKLTLWAFRDCNIGHGADLNG